MKPLAIIAAMTPLSLALLFVVFWALLFSADYTAFLSIVGFFLFLPIKLDNKRFWIARVSTLMMTLILLAKTIHIPIGEINHNIELLSRKPRDPESISSFSAREKLGIYGLNLMMSLSAYPKYPEVSKETILMILPAPLGGIRTFQSDFALNSRSVCNLVKQWNMRLENEKTNKVRFKSRLHWHAKDYALGNSEARYALALNPCTISMLATRQSSKWLLDIRLRVECKYPQHSNVTLITHPKLQVEEGLFWVLQQAEWLFPYTAEWKFTMASDDKRICS